MRIEVKKYMTQKATPEFDFMAKWNNDNPMPLRIMTGVKVKETKGMVYMKLHGDMYAEKMCTCMKCGRPLTNPVSQYFGIGPECGGHNYVHPFDTDEELKAAVDAYKKQLVDIKWEGWIIKSAITDWELTDGDIEAVEKVEPKKVVITIDIRKADKCNGDQALFIKFDYDQKVVDVIRGLATRYWNKDTKEWEVPVNKLDELKKEFAGYEVNVTGEVVEKKEVTYVDGFEFKTTPFQHQVDGFNYGLNNDRFLLGDEQGLGKTKQVIDIAVAKKLQKGYKHCLIICGVNGLKWNWVNEVHTHSNEDAWILGQRIKNHKTVIGSNTDKLNDLRNVQTISAYFIITNVESLRDEKIVAEIASKCAKKEIGIVAIDEIHKCKNPASQQGKGILKVQPECRIAMTGTPLMNQPMDLFIILKWLGFEKHAFYAFKKHYCIFGGYGGYEILGYRYLNELQERLDEIMLRRLKNDVLDLPEKTHITEYVEMTPKQKQIYDEVTADIKMNIDQIKMANNPLAELIRMRQATGYTGILSSTVKESAKLDRMEELVDEAIENGKKVVIFSNWTQMTLPIYNRLAVKYQGTYITGEVDSDQRQEHVKRFQEDGDCRFIVGTIGAMGTGLTLTAGTVEIFMDEPWNRANKEQAEDRCHRVGTKENVTIYTLICKNTIDERINELVEKKGAMADALVDGKITIDKKAMLDFLLN